MKVQRSESRADASRYAAAPQDFLGMGPVSKGIQRKRPPVIKTTRGLDTPLAHRSLDIPCQVASPQSPTPFLQTISV
jgi:hypothetical protein